MTTGMPHQSSPNRTGIPYWLLMVALIAAAVAGYMWHEGMLNNINIRGTSPPTPTPIAIDAPPPGTSDALHPEPRYSPADVVMIQLRSLQHKDEPTADAGVYTTYLFASMANHQVTGTYEGFARFKGDDRYAPMLNARSVELLYTDQEGEQVRPYCRVVGPDGRVAYYMFEVSMENRGEFQGCWVTDGCVPVDINDLNGPATPQPPHVDPDRPWQPSMN